MHPQPLRNGIRHSETDAGNVAGHADYGMIEGNRRLVLDNVVRFGPVCLLSEAKPTAISLGWPQCRAGVPGRSGV